jgi:uncharacterized protein
MNSKIPRRDFLIAAPATAGWLAYAAHASAKSVTATNSRSRIEPFDYEGVRLLDSPWQQQIQQNRAYYLSLTNDDILQGFRQAAGLPAPGTPLGGWCSRDSSTVFGQWLSGMARLSKANADSELHDKASNLLAEWSKTVKPDGDCSMRHYAWEKLCCGLVDMHLYADDPNAMPLLEKMTDYASKNFEHQNMSASGIPHGLPSGRPGEWYTMAENLYRAYQATGNPKFRDFAEVWLYPAYWNKFADNSAPQDVAGVHAYSHVNSFNSAAMHYEVTGDATYLRILRNAYDYLQQTQCYATGGYGPEESMMALDGSLGKSLELSQNTFEAVCGSWAGFKLSRYLMRFTGEARYGDWTERLLYNCVGAALPLVGGGKNFYYSDYRLSGGMKVYRYDQYTCCSGSLFQNIGDYSNLIYYKDPTSLYINLYVPSEVTWVHEGTSIKVRQESQYPFEETSKLTLSLQGSKEFPLKFRVPEWANGMSIQVNGAASDVACAPGTWASVSRAWKTGDTVQVRIPLRFRWQPVDQQHPNRAAIVRGPVLMAMDYSFIEQQFAPPDSDESLNKLLTLDSGQAPHRGGFGDTPPPGPAVFVLRDPDGREFPRKFRPYFTYGENYPYLAYFDLKAWPVKMW